MDEPAGRDRYSVCRRIGNRRQSVFAPDAAIVPKLKGAHGTLTMGVGRTGDVLVYSAPARLIEVTSNWEGANRYGVQSWLPVSAIWQLKDHLSN